MPEQHTLIGPEVMLAPERQDEPCLGPISDRLLRHIQGVALLQRHCRWLENNAIAVDSRLVRFTCSALRSSLPDPALSLGDITYYR